VQIDLWPIERVVPYDRNPRQNDQAIDAVAASLKEFGWRQPIVVDRDGVKQHPTFTRKDFKGAFEIAFYGWKESASNFPLTSGTH
jgi:ParB-like chromosome segregation protein Spo0J